MLTVSFALLSLHEVKQRKFLVWLSEQFILQELPQFGLVNIGMALFYFFFCFNSLSVDSDADRGQVAHILSSRSPTKEKVRA